ncbi:hypothetical protein C4J96_2216 [Pseudomonas orientalis]|uniref:hypothetical protein n=1 Tax=Pseudomonas orientalis TaxID=76758 RepID=UPI000F6B885E|nr:hypothetical protein [Pseudomonas orientalis]AZE94334.1 hypothetical protein C4J96_2216 [Pseudomonas orientalis]
MAEIINSQLYSKAEFYPQAPSLPPKNQYEAKSDKELLQTLAVNFRYFDPKGGPVPQAKFNEIANRQVPSGNDRDDAMTMLAKTFTDRGPLNYWLDKIGGKGAVDGMISLEDVEKAISQSSNKEPAAVNRFPGAPRSFNNAVGNANRGLMNPVQNLSIGPQGFSGQPEPAGLLYSKIAAAFLENFEVFQGANGYASMATIAAIAYSPMRNDPFTDQMIWLAQAIMSSPLMRFMLDSKTQNGQQDGLISFRDAQITANELRALQPPSYEQAMGWQPPSYEQAMGWQPPSYEQAMGWQPPSYEQAMGWQPPSYEQAMGRQPPSYEEAKVQQPYYNNGPLQEVTTTNNNPYAYDSDEDFSTKVLPYFGVLEDPATPGYISDNSLRSVASGFRPDGSRATLEEQEIAENFRSRGGFFKKLDRGSSGQLDGLISRTDLSRFATDYSGSTDHDVLKGIKKYFHEYTAGKDDAYVNFNELREAAGEIPSTRTFPDDAREYAKEFLKRVDLADKTDVGVSCWGLFNGKRDERFDMDNLDYMLDQTK